MVDILYIITLVPTILLSSLRTDDDGYDKANYKYTVGMLVLFAAITATKQFDDDRIECWNRANFMKAYVEYTNQICYISSTYYVDRNSSIPVDLQKRKESQLNYYQWTPFIILLMALFFYMPRLIWRALSVRSGIDLQDIVEAADDTKKIKEEEGNHERLVKYIVATIDMYVDDARRQMDAENRQRSVFLKMFQLICCTTGKFLGNYFITLYIFIKVYYILNVLLQIWLLNIFLGTNFFWFGLESVKLFRFGLNQPESKYFPRETFCDFYVREPLRGEQPLQRITVQCVLTVNLFNQQIFTIMWIWFVILFLLNTYSLGVWAVRLGSYRKRHAFILSRLRRTGREEVPRFRIDYKHVTREAGDFVQQELVRSFIMQYLEPDGYFFIRVLILNVSDFVVQEIIEQLWTNYLLKYGENDARAAELRYSQYRFEPSRSTSVVTTQISAITVPDNDKSVSDTRRQFLRRYSAIDTGLLGSTSGIELTTALTTRPNESV